MKITRGDTAQFKFQRLDSEGNPITTQPQKLYFTVKRNYIDKEVMLQKTIGDMTFDEEFYYHFTIEPSDTDNLMYTDYVYDIEVVQQDYKQTISKGTFTVSEEVTHADNEV